MGLPLKYERLFYLNGRRFACEWFKVTSIDERIFLSVWEGAFLGIKQKRKKKPWSALQSQQRGLKGQIANEHFVSSQTKQ